MYRSVSKVLSPPLCQKFCHFFKQVFLPFRMSQFCANLHRFVSHHCPFHGLGYYKSYVIHLSSSKAQSKTYTTKASENTIDLHMF